MDPKDQVTVIRFNKADGLVHIDTFDKGLIESLNAAQKKEPVMFIVSEPDRYGEKPSQALHREQASLGSDHLRNAEIL